MSHKMFHTLRWVVMILTFFLLSYGIYIFGKWITAICLPVFACGLNTDQFMSSFCYDFFHLDYLISEGIHEVLSYVITFVLLSIVFGRMFCGFICPMGLLQDITWKISDALHVEKITRKEKFMQVIDICKYIILICALGFAFIGIDFCNFCPAIVTFTGLSGFRSHLTVGYFLAVALFIMSFFMRRFWCNICPLGYLVGLLHKISFFRLKKDCTACTECAACYEACPMRIKEIYTITDKDDVTTTDCLFCGECVRKCPEDNALAISFFKLRFYKSSRHDFENNLGVNLRASRGRLPFVNIRDIYKNNDIVKKEF